MILNNAAAKCILKILHGPLIWSSLNKQMHRDRKGQGSCPVLGRGQIVCSRHRASAARMQKFWRGMVVTAAQRCACAWPVTHALENDITSSLMWNASHAWP